MSFGSNQPTDAGGSAGAGGGTASVVSGEHPIPQRILKNTLQCLISKVAKYNSQLISLLGPCSRPVPLQVTFEFTEVTLAKHLSSISVINACHPLPGNLEERQGNFYQSPEYL